MKYTDYSKNDLNIDKFREYIQTNTGTKIDYKKCVVFILYLFFYLFFLRSINPYVFCGLLCG